MRRIAGWSALICFLFLPATRQVSAKEANADVAPFGRPLIDKNSVGVEWPEMRRVARVEVQFADDGSPLPAPKSMKVEYWHGVWNGAAIRRYGVQNAGDTGWAGDDDWFNGGWKTADTRARNEGRSITFSFAPSNEKEFPDLKVLGVPYRPTLKLRLAFAGAHAKVASLRAFTDSLWQNPESVRIQFENRSQCNDPVEVYNGSVVKDSERVDAEGGNCTLSATVISARNSDDPEADRTIVTVRSPSNPFSFAMDEVMRGDRIFIKDFGVLVTRASDRVTIAEAPRALEEIGEKTIYAASRTIRSKPCPAPGMIADQAAVLLHPGPGRGAAALQLDPTGDLWANHPIMAEKRPEGHRPLPLARWHALPVWIGQFPLRGSLPGGRVFAHRDHALDSRRSALRTGRFRRRARCEPECLASHAE